MAILSAFDTTDRADLDRAKQLLRHIRMSIHSVGSPGSEMTLDQLEAKISEQEATVSRLKAEWDDAETARLTALDAQRVRFEADHAAADTASN